jgi:hypothetical protein
MPQFILTIAITLFACLQSQAEVTKPKAVVLESRIDFGRVMRGALIQHELAVDNHGSAQLLITRITMTAPLTVRRIPRIEPGQRGHIPITLDTSEISGSFKGEVVLFCNDPATPEIHISFAGEVFESVELSPLPGFFIATTRDIPKEQSIEIINHETQPLRILKIEHPPDGFSTKLDTVKDGQHYRLTVLMPGTGPAGKSLERILVHTSSADQPLISIPVNTWLRERVYTFPDEVDMGVLPFETINRNPELLRRLSQTLMVYQVGGRAFEIRTHTDLPGVSIGIERGPQGDRWQLTVSFREDVQPGSMKGLIHIETNDPEFKTLTVPIRGSLLIGGK